MGKLLEAPCIKFVKYLEELFFGNEKSLIEYLDRKIEPTSFSALELVGYFGGIPQSRHEWSTNFKIVSEYHKKLQEAIAEH